MPVPAPRSFPDAWTVASGIEGWLTEDQARRLWQRAAELAPGASVVEIGSFRGRSAVVLAAAAPEGIVAIDPHGGGDRGPQEITADFDRGEADNEAFRQNVERAGVSSRVRHVRRRSEDALDDVTGPVDLLWIDGAHRYAPALHDIGRWGARVVPGGYLLLHDSFNAVGVTLAQLRALVFSRRYRFLGRTGSLSEYRREDLAPLEAVRNAATQLRQLGYFARSLLIKLALTANQPRLARLLGHEGADWPY